MEMDKIVRAVESESDDEYENAIVALYFPIIYEHKTNLFNSVPSFYSSFYCLVLEPNCGAPGAPSTGFSHLSAGSRRGATELALTVPTR